MVVAEHFADIRESWKLDEAVYRRLVDEVVGRLGPPCRQRGVAAEYSGRTKELSSLLKKSLKKGLAYDAIHDKAGARVVVAYPDQVGLVEEAIRSTFQILHHENKIQALEANRLGYLGVHFEVSLPETSAPKDLRGKRCEIQIHTRAQHLWAATSHALSYKPVKALPAAVERAIFRLMALVEIFDESVTMARSTILSSPGFEAAQLLEILEPHFYKLGGRFFDRELSMEVLGRMLSVFDPGDIPGYTERLAAFVANHTGKLERIYHEYASDNRHLLLMQPESLLAFERLEADSYRLQEVWSSQIPRDLLESLALVWGSPLPGPV